MTDKPTAPTIITKNKFQTKHGNLDATNAHPQLAQAQDPGQLRTIDPIVFITW